MKNNTLPITVFVSPRTGFEYLIMPKTSTRMMGDWYSNEPLRPVEQTTYEIIFNGRLVQFALSEEGVAACVERFENPGPDLSSRYD